MEFCEGKSLYEKILEGRMSEQMAKKYFDEIIGALYYIHTKNICHGNIKPKNILICNKTGKVKLIDFKFSHFLAKNEKRLKNNIYNHNQFNKNADKFKRDIWAIGIILHVMLTQEIPPNILHTNSNDQFDIYNQDFPSLSEDVTKLINGCLSFDPNQRFSAKEALE